MNENEYSTFSFIFIFNLMVQTILLLLLLKKIGNARPGEGDCHPISPKTPAPQYQPIEERREIEISWRQKSR